MFKEDMTLKSSIDYDYCGLWGWHSTEVPFALLTQQPRVRYISWQEIFLITAYFVDSIE